LKKNGGGKMAVKAYFLITAEEEFWYDGYQEIVRDLKAVPEVKAIEPVRGRCNLLVHVEAPIRAIMVAHKIIPLKWVKRLDILTVEPIENSPHRDEEPQDKLKKLADTLTETTDRTPT